MAAIIGEYKAKSKRKQLMNQEPWIISTWGRPKALSAEKSRSRVGTSKLVPFPISGDTSMPVSAACNCEFSTTLHAVRQGRLKLA
jgi:hypothetical protein